MHSEVTILHPLLSCTPWHHLSNSFQSSRVYHSIHALQVIHIAAYGNQEAYLFLKHYCHLPKREIRLWLEAMDPDFSSSLSLPNAWKITLLSRTGALTPSCIWTTVEFLLLRI